MALRYFLTFDCHDSLILPAKPAHQKKNKEKSITIFFPTLLCLRSYHQILPISYQTTQLNQKITVHEKKKLASVNPKQPVFKFKWHYDTATWKTPWETPRRPLGDP
jgi:hypothetical protein